MSASQPCLPVFCCVTPRMAALENAAMQHPRRPTVGLGPSVSKTRSRRKGRGPPDCTAAWQLRRPGASGHSTSAQRSGSVLIKQGGQRTFA